MSTGSPREMTDPHPDVGVRRGKAIKRPAKCYAAAESIIQRVEAFLHKIIERQYREEHDVPVRGALPDREDQFKTGYGPFAVSYNVLDRELTTVTYQAQNDALSPNRIIADGDGLIEAGCPSDLREWWDDTFGKHESRRDYPDMAPPDPDQIAQQIRRVRAAFTKLDRVLATVICGRDEISIARSLEESIADLRRNDHDLSPLLNANVGGRTPLYRNSEIALVVPVLAERLDRQQEGYVIGIDDTDAGVFAHAIGIGPVGAPADITRERIEQAMGFDTHFLPPTGGDDIEDLAAVTPGRVDPVAGRIRIQGDFRIERTIGPTDLNDVEAVLPESADVPSGPAVGYKDVVHHIGIAASESEASETETMGEFRDALNSGVHLPVDNHLFRAGAGVPLPHEDSTVRPVQVVVPHDTELQVVHHEHDPITTTLPAGVWELSLLDRGEGDSEWPVDT